MVDAYRYRIHKPWYWKLIEQAANKHLRYNNNDDEINHWLINLFALIDHGGFEDDDLWEFDDTYELDKEHTLDGLKECLMEYYSEQGHVLAEDVERYDSFLDEVLYNSWFKYLLRDYVRRFCDETRVIKSIKIYKRDLVITYAKDD